MATVNVRVDDTLKKETEKVLESMGLSLSSAISVYFAQIVKQQEIPFRITAQSTPKGDTYYNADWYKGKEAAELLRRSKSDHWVMHDAPEIDGYESDI